MLYRIECDKFQMKVDGHMVPRGPITFHDGLNTIVGGNHADNSIGKSTLLLIIDFCFGGNAYVDPKVSNANDPKHVGNHTIKFTMKFDGIEEYYSRNTLRPDEILVCDSNYMPIKDPISLDEYTQHLYEQYHLENSGDSFREVVGRYQRIYLRGNTNEVRPLSYDYETSGSAAVKSLEKLFHVYKFIEDYEAVYTEKKKEKDAHKAASDYHLTGNVPSGKRGIKENEEEIDNLKTELQNLQNKEDADLSSQQNEQIDKAAEIKARLKTMRRKRTMLRTQQDAIRENLSGENVLDENDIEDLMEFFPNVNQWKILQVDEFHQKMQKILASEMKEDIQNIEDMISALENDIKVAEEELRATGVPVNISQKFLQQHAELTKKIDELERANSERKKWNIVRDETKEALTALQEAREAQLKKIEEQLNQELYSVNEYIYNGENYAPTISFSSTRTGKPDYYYHIPEDTGTGANYRGMIMLDLAMLHITDLPFITHDSLIFKNVEDLPIDEIMELYAKSPKQIFIAFDKKDAYSQITGEIIQKTKVIELHQDGGELFGWSWAKKKNNRNNNTNEES